MVNIKLDSAKIMNTSFSNANLSKSSLRKAHILNCQFNNTNMNDIELDSCVVDNNWFQLITKQKVKGVNQILEKYDKFPILLVLDDNDKNNQKVFKCYLLKKKSKKSYE